MIFALLGLAPSALGACLSSGCSLCSTISSTCVSPGFCTENYFLNISNICQLCESNCLTCTGLGQCTNCRSSNFRYLSGSSCTCMPGYLEASPAAATCVGCPDGCLTCSSTTVCVNCYSIYVLSSGNCNCPSRTYRLVTTAGLVKGGCPPCSKSCQTCNSATVCTACIAPFQLASGACVSAETKSAVNGCITISGAGACTSCATGEYRYFLGGQCPCVTGYIQTAGTNFCQLCSYSCYTCDILTTNCTSCLSNYFRTLNSNACNCKVRYYDVGLPGCVACPSICTACSSSTLCSSCIDGFFVLNNNCVVCLPECLTCNSAATCLKCPNFAFRYFAANLCPCVTGYYQSGSLICAKCDPSCKTGCTNGNPCQLCHYSCVACSNPTRSDCTACDFSKFRYLDSGQCLCAAGYFDPGLLSTSTADFSTCILCDITCAECQGFSTSCTVCDISKFRTFLLNRCPCISNYFDNSGTCTPCHVSCLNCFGSNQFSCSSCDASANRQLSSYQCPCVIGFYQTSQQGCYSCGANCVTCTSGTVCTSCSSGYYLNTVGAATSCIACQRPCVTCNSALICSSCDSIRYSFNGTFCNCVNGFYNVAGYCNPCLYVCQTCTVNTACVTCKSGLVFNAGDCIACNPMCLVCQNELDTGCVSCDSNKYLTLSGPAPNTCICITGYFFEQRNCVGCYITCATCSSFNFCLSCAGGLIMNFDNTCVCPLSNFYDPTISSCRSCIQPCLNCIGSSYCTSCVVGYFLSGFLCLPGCPDGTYPSIGGNVIQCSFCIVGCATCEKAGTCKVCLVALGYTLQGLFCQLSCNSRYQQVGGVCVACLSNQVYLNGVCQYSCPTGYMADSNFICNPCSDCSTKFALSISEANEISNGLRILLTTNLTVNGSYFTNPSIANVTVILSGSTTGTPLKVVSIESVANTVTLVAAYGTPLVVSDSTIAVQFNVIPWAGNSPLSTVLIQGAFSGVEYKKSDVYCYASNFLSVVFLIIFMATLPWNMIGDGLGRLFFIQTLALFAFVSSSVNVSARTFYYCFCVSSFNFFNLPTGEEIPDPLVNSLGLKNTPQGIAGGSIIFFFIFAAFRVALLSTRKFLSQRAFSTGLKVTKIPILFAVFTGSEYLRTATSQMKLTKLTSGQSSGVALSAAIIAVAILLEIGQFIIQVISKEATMMKEQDFKLVEKVIYCLLKLVNQAKFTEVALIAGFFGTNPVGAGLMLCLFLLSWMSECLDHPDQKTKSTSGNILARLLDASAFARYFLLTVLLILSYAATEQVPLVIIASTMIAFDVFACVIYGVLKLTGLLYPSRESDKVQYETQSLWLEKELLVNIVQQNSHAQLQEQGQSNDAGTEKKISEQSGRNKMSAVVPMVDQQKKKTIQVQKKQSKLVNSQAQRRQSKLANAQAERRPSKLAVAQQEARASQSRQEQQQQQRRKKRKKPKRFNEDN